MGKFDGMLLVSDFDNTFLFTEEALLEGGDTGFSPRDLDRVRYWMEQGGRFTIATGRAMMAFRPYAETVPTNMPVIVDNGGAIYDFQREEYFLTTFLPTGARERVEHVLEKFPHVALEIYHPYPNELLQVMNPTPWNERHARLTGIGYTVVHSLGADTVPEPISKVLFVADNEVLWEICAVAREEGWFDDYELIFSSDHLLEMTARGANKGDMVKKLKELSGCHTLICAGDHLNDMSMLRKADYVFCPANAEAEVRAFARTVCHCREGAVGEIIEILDREIQ